MSRLVGDDGIVDLQKVVQTNPNIELNKVVEAREMIRTLRGYGIADRDYTLAPPFRRQVYVDIKHRKDDDRAPHST